MSKGKDDGRVPPLANGMPRVDYDPASPEERFTAIVTDDEPIFLLAGDSDHVLVFESVSGFPSAAVVRAVRRR
jgi:hypothetical protein